MHNTPTLIDYFQQEKKVIFDQWFNLIMATYSELTAKLWKTNNDPFTNPVRYHFEIGMHGILNALAVGNSVPEMNELYLCSTKSFGYAQYRILHHHRLRLLFIYLKKLFVNRFG